MVPFVNSTHFEHQLLPTDLLAYDLTDFDDVKALLRDLPFRRIPCPAGRRIANLVLREVKGIRCARGAILEGAYVDHDYAEAFGRFYARTFPVYPKFCKRLHFFSIPVTYDHIAAKHEELRNSYLGFVVLRPTPPHVVSRTVLSPPFDNDKDKITIKVDENVNLAGISLKAHGYPFIEQDGQVARCATAGVWMTSAAMARICNTSLASTTKITERANTTQMPFGRAFPSPGLTMSQMSWALSSMGYEPIVLEFPDCDGDAAAVAKSLIFKYARSGIPVTLVIETETDHRRSDHVLTVIGYIHGDIQESSEKQGRLADASKWVSQFIVHDDLSGPYRTIELIQRSGRCHIDETVDSLSPHTPPWSHAILSAVIIPHPPRVHITADQAEGIAAATLEVMTESLPSVSNALPDRLFIRTYLMRSNDFKDTFARIGSQPIVALYYRNLMMPKYVWVVEVGAAPRPNQHMSEQHDILGRVLIDATAPADAYNLLSIRLPGVCVRPIVGEWRLHLTPVWSGGIVPDPFPHMPAPGLKPQLTGQC